MYEKEIQSFPSSLFDLFYNIFTSKNSYLFTKISIGSLFNLLLNLPSINLLAQSSNEKLVQIKNAVLKVYF